MQVTVKEIIPTGFRYLPKSVIGRVGEVLMQVEHHGLKWVRVGFKADKKSLGQMTFGNETYDFLKSELTYE